MYKLQFADPEQLGIPSEVLLKLSERLNSLEYINSIIIMRHGKAALEYYRYPYSKDIPHQLFSLSKSFTSCAIGLAQEENLLKLSDKLISFFPEYDKFITDERMRLVTIEDLLTMRSGHLSCTTQYLQADTTDFVKAYLATPLDTMPGKEFAYNSGASYMLSAIISKITGLQLREYLMPRLFEPLNMTPGIWESCPRGINFGGWGLYMTTRDIAKFAQLLLQKGKWLNKQIIPEDYLNTAVQRHADNSKNTLPDWQVGYGYHFWCSRHGYRGDGAAGQYAIVLEKEDISIAVTSCTDNMYMILDAIWEELLPHLADSPLPPNPDAAGRLRQITANVPIPITLPTNVKYHKNTFFQFQDNPADIRNCSVEFGENCCTLTFQTSRGYEHLRAGFGEYQKSFLQLTDSMPHPVAACASWIDDEVLKITTFNIDGIYRDIWLIDFNNTVEPIKNTGLCGCFRQLKPALLIK